MTPKKVERKSDKGEKKAKPEKKAAPMKHSDERFLLIELSCKDMKCSPCTYPNCQRFAKTTLQSMRKKAPFKVKVTELKKGEDVKALLKKEAKA
jgi:hypothetical protein